jgi:MoxR-like ATPase
MTVDTVAYTAHDAALAISMMTDAQSGDIQFTDQASFAAQFNAVETRVRNTVASVMKAHGVRVDGDIDEGNEAAAKSIVEACGRYLADPSAYMRAIEDADEEEEAGTAPVPIAAARASAQSSPAVPLPQSSAIETALDIVQDFGTVLQPYVPPVAKPSSVRIVERVSRDVFPGLPDSMATMTVPTTRWKGDAPEIETPDEHFCFDSYAVRVMSLAVRQRKNVMAVGDPGCGKTEFFRQFAARIGLPFHKVAMDGSISRPDVLGSFRQVATPTGSATPFILGLLPTIIQTPCIIDFDEMDQCDPDLQYMLHSLYEGEGLDIKEDGGRFIKRHEHCYLVATANTKGRGSDNGLTHARHEMSEATRDRYSFWLEFTYLPKDKEMAVLMNKTGLDADRAGKLVDIGTSIRNGYKTGVVSQPCSLRQLLDVAEAADGLGYDPMLGLALACDTVMVGRANAEDVSKIREYVKLSTGKDLKTVIR